MAQATGFWLPAPFSLEHPAPSVPAVVARRCHLISHQRDCFSLKKFLPRKKMYVLFRHQRMTNTVPKEIVLIIVHLTSQEEFYFSTCFAPFSTLHSRVLSDQTQLQEDSESFRRKHAQLQREFTHLQQSCQDLKRMHEADQKEISELRRQQQLVTLLLVFTHESVCQLFSCMYA